MIRQRCRSCESLLPPAGEPVDGPCPRCALAGAIALGDSTVVARRPVVEGYETLYELGRGAMGIVWLARDLALDRLVALKLISPGGDPRLGSRLLREGRAVAQLRHPNIVAVHTLGDTPDGTYLVMDFLPDGDLETRLKTKPLSPSEAALLVAKVADALAHAHAAGVLHRDVKPSNILLDASNEPQLADFGLAAPLDGAGDLTLPGQIAGTPAYLAPELLAGATHASPRSDIYGLGAVLYACLTGRAPFVGETTAAIFTQIATEDPPPLRRFNPTAPRELEIIALKCLEKDPAQRYATVADLARDLDNFLRNRPLQAQPRNCLSAARKFVQRNRPLVGAAAGVTLALVTALALSITFRSREHTANRQLRAAHAQAENLMTLLLRDVRPSLEQFGRVAELDRFAEETVRYLSELPAELQDATYAGNRAVALSVYAWVRWRSGDFDGAARTATEVLVWRQHVLDGSPDEFRRIAPLMRDVISLRNGGGKSVAAVKDRPLAEANVRRLRELAGRYSDDLFLAKELAIELMGLAALAVNPDRDPSAGRAELTEARDLMQRVVARAPDNSFLRVILADAVLDLAWVYKRCGEYERGIAESEAAVAMLETTSAARPGNLLLLEHLAQAEHALAHQWAVLSLARARDVERAARKHYQALSVADPDHAIWREMFACSHTIDAWYLLSNGNLAAAREAFARIDASCESIPASHSWANPMLLPWRFIDDGRAAAGLGDIDAARARADEARERFEKVIASRPAGSPGRTRNRIGALLAEAELFSTTGDWPSVETLAREAATLADAYARDQQLERSPRFDRGEARRLLGVAHLRQGRAAEAVAFLRESISLLSGALPVMHPFSSRELRLADARDALAEALISLGDRAEARRALDEGLAFREADLARQPELAAVQVAFARTAALYANAFDPDDRDSIARRRHLISRATEVIAPPAAENRLTLGQRQIASWISTLAGAP